MRAGWVFLLGVLAGAGGVALVNHVFQRSQTTEVVAETIARATQPPDDRTQANVPTQADPPAIVEREHSPVSDERGAAPATLESRVSSEWNALVGGILEWHAEHRTGERLSAARRDRLVAELARLREASLAEQEAPSNPGDPAELRERLARTLTIAQVDAAFREELGIGVGEFVRQLDRDAVEDVPRPRNLRPLALVLLAVCSEHATSASEIAAHINDEQVPTARVDAISPHHVEHIRSRLMETARQALEDLIDRRLGIAELPEAARSRQRQESYHSHNVRLALPQPQALESPLPPDQIVAVIADDPIRASELERAAALQLYRLRGELYLQRRRDLDRFIEQRLLQLEAQRRGVTLEALERSLSEVDSVTDTDIAELVSRERAAGRTVDAERVRPYLEFQKRYQRRTSMLQGIRAATQIRIDLLPPVRPRLPVDARGGVALGATDGPILVAYTNYVCAPCRTTHAELDRVLAAGRPSRIVLRDFVDDPVALQAAALVRCAARNARAAPMRRYLLEHEPPRTGDAWFSAQLESVASIAGMKPSELRGCIDAPEVRSGIEQDTKSALRLGFDKPPAFIAAGVPLSGMQSAEQLVEALGGKSTLRSTSTS